jgi:hypothetical protein
MLSLAAIGNMAVTRIYRVVTRLLKYLRVHTLFLIGDVAEMQMKPVSRISHC